MKRLVTSIFLISAFVLVTSHPLNMQKTELKTVVIDAGHGGKDPGCIGAGKKSFEKDVALDIALRVGKLIKQKMPDVNVIYTRKSDVFVPLWKRASIANKNRADLFISIHCNANETGTLHGTESYVMGIHKSEQNLNVSKRENASILLEEDYKNNENYNGFDPESDEAHIIFSLYQNAYREQSLELAGKFQNVIETKKIRRNLGVKEAGFLVLWRTAMPSILVETGFLTNAQEQEFLLSEKGKSNLSESIFMALRSYKYELEAN